MHAGVALGLLAGLGAGFGLGWWSRGGEQLAEPILEAPRADRPATEKPHAPALESASDAGDPTSQAPASTGASRHVGSAPPTDTLTLQGHGGPPSYEENGWARAALLRKYLDLSKGKAFPPEDLEAQVEGLEQSLTHASLQRNADWWAESKARDILAREVLREAEGVLASPVLARFQSLGQRLSTSLTPKADRPDPKRSREPLDIDAPGKGRLAGLWFVRGGVIPRRHEFCIESVEVEIRSTSGSRSAGRTVQIELPSGAIQVLSVGSSQSLRYEGSACLREGEEDRLKVEFDREALCEVRVAGRLIPLGEVRPTPRPFRATQVRGDGYLTGEALLFQVVADHGGGNPRTVHLDGSDNDRFDVRSDRSVWDEGIALADLKRASLYVEGAGVPPPGKEFEIHRVTWRGRRQLRSHSQLVIGVGGTRILSLPDESREAALTRAQRENKDEAEERVEGSWTGQVRVGGATRVRDALEVTAAYFAMLEVRVEGSLVEAPER